MAAADGSHRVFDESFGRLWYGEPDAISNAIGFAKFFQPLT